MLLKMGYIKTISYSNLIEIYEYEEDIRYTGRKGRNVQKSNSLQGLDSVGRDLLFQSEQKPKKRQDNANRASMVFRRLVSANLGQSDVPLFISLTFAGDSPTIGQGHEAFNAFARNCRREFGENIRYVAVPEFGTKGTQRLHFHALFWGVDSKRLAETERRTRLFAGLWGKGFVDLVATDGSHKLAGYMAKYMAKAFMSPLLNGKKSYIASRNIIRPVVDKKALLFPLFCGELLDLPDLSTFEPIRDISFVAKWLGKGRFRLYQS